MDQDKLIKQNKYSITDGKILPAFIMFMLPLMATSLMMQSYVIADGLILGNAINENALGSVNTVGSINDICTVLQIALAGGCSICVSHLYGAKNYNDLDKLIIDIYKIIIVISVAIALIAFAGARWILELINTPDNLMDGAILYLRVIALGLPFTSLYALQSGVLRGMGDSKKPLGGITVSSCVNIGLDLLFVVVFKFGIAGAAIATVTANILSAVYLHIKLQQKRKTYQLSDEYVAQSKVEECMKLSAPQVAQSLATSLGKVMLQNITNLLGASVVIGVTVAFKVDGMLVIPLMCMSQAISVFAGQNTGAGNQDRVKESLKLSILLSLAFSALLTFVLWKWGYYLFGFFGLGAESAAYGYRYITVCLPFYWLFGLQFVFNGYLNGCKHTTLASVSSIAGLAARVGLAYISYQIIGADVLPLGESLSWLIGVVIDIAAIYYFTKRYRKS